MKTKEEIDIAIDAMLTWVEDNPDKYTSYTSVEVDLYDDDLDQLEDTPTTSEEEDAVDLFCASFYNDFVWQTPSGEFRIRYYSYDEYTYRSSDSTTYKELEKNPGLIVNNDVNLYSAYVWLAHDTVSLTDMSSPHKRNLDNIKVDFVKESVKANTIEMGKWFTEYC